MIKSLAILNRTQGITMQTEIHENIRFMRENKNLTQEEMADKLNMSTSGYAKIERGETKLYHEKLDKIADVFGVSINHLFPSKNENITVCMSANESTDCNNNNSVYYGDSDIEIAQLKKSLAYSAELLQQKNSELQTLKDVIELLKDKIKHS